MTFTNTATTASIYTFDTSIAGWSATTTTGSALTGTIVWQEWLSADARGCYGQWVELTAAQANFAQQAEYARQPRAQQQLQAQQQLLQNQQQNFGLNHQQLQNQQIQQAPYGYVRRSQEEQAAEELYRQRYIVEPKKRAEELLLGQLSEEQKHDMLTRGHFFLLTKSGRRYRIARRTHGNIVLLDGQDRAVTQYCAQPNNVPVDDAVLAQKLALELDEESFLRVANATHFR